MGRIKAASRSVVVQLHVGTLYETKRKVEQAIEDDDLDERLTLGKISLRAGMLLTLVNENTPDDPDKQQQLEQAAAAVLGRPV